jgi:hypothetical protein
MGVDCGYWRNIAITLKIPPTRIPVVSDVGSRQGCPQVEFKLLQEEKGSGERRASRLYIDNPEVVLKAPPLCIGYAGSHHTSSTPSILTRNISQAQRSSGYNRGDSAHQVICNQLLKDGRKIWYLSPKLRNNTLNGHWRGLRCQQIRVR